MTPNPCEFHKVWHKNCSGMSSEKNLLIEVQSLKEEIKKLKSRKKYGLVWEEKLEEFHEISIDAP